jgi:hypothetical protein
VVTRDSRSAATIFVPVLSGSAVRSDKELLAPATSSYPASAVRGFTVRASAVRASAVRASAVRGFTVRASAVRGFTVRGFTVRGFTVRGFTVRASAVRGFTATACARLSQISARTSLATRRFLSVLTIRFHLPITFAYLYRHKSGTKVVKTDRKMRKVPVIYANDPAGRVSMEADGQSLMHSRRITARSACGA